MDEEKFKEEQTKRILSGAESYENIVSSFPKPPQKVEKTKYIILEKTKSCYSLILPHLNNFPANAKFTIREKIENSIIDSIRFLVKGNYAENNFDRRKLMLEYLSEIHIISILLYQSMLSKYLSYQNYEQVHSLVKELSAMGSERYKRLGGNEKI